MLKGFFFFIFLIMLAQMPIQAANHDAIMVPYCVPQLQACFNKIKQLPEIGKLISIIQREGPIHILVSNHKLAKEFGAFWDPNQRVIFVNTSWHSSEGQVISSIIFELHNASINSKLNRLNRLARMGQIDKHSYVEAIERLEYANSLNTSNIIQKGIHLKVLPVSARISPYPSFEQHYSLQKQVGHSVMIARNYDLLVQR